LTSVGTNFPVFHAQWPSKPSWNPEADSELVNGTPLVGWSCPPQGTARLVEANTSMERDRRAVIALHLVGFWPPRRAIWAVEAADYEAERIAQIAAGRGTWTKAPVCPVVLRRFG